MPFGIRRSRALEVKTFGLRRTIFEQYTAVVLEIEAVEGKGLHFR